MGFSHNATMPSRTFPQSFHHLLLHYFLSLETYSNYSSTSSFISFFDILPLAFGNFWSHFCIENSLLCFHLPEALFYTVNTWLQIKGVDPRHNMIFVWNQYSLFHCNFYCVSHITWLLHYATLLLGGILPNSTRDFLTELHCIIVISWFPVSLFFYCLDPYFITIPILSSNIYIVIPV